MPDVRAADLSRIPWSMELLSALHAEGPSLRHKSGGAEELMQELKSAHMACSLAVFHQLTGDSHEAAAGFRDAIAHTSASISIAERDIFPSEDLKLGILANLYSCRGIHKLMLGDAVADGGSDHAKDASVDFLKSLELRESSGSSHDGGVHFNLGQAYMLSGNLDSAIESFERACSADKNHAKARLLKGLLHRERGEEDQARHDIYRAVCLDASLYKEEFAPIIEAERESEAIWDELLSRPEADAALKELEDEARAMLRSRKSE